MDRGFGWGRVAGEVARCVVVAAALIGGFAVQGASAQKEIGGDAFQRTPASVQRVAVPVNKSITFESKQPFTRAVVGAVELADVLPLSNQSFYIQGKKVGTTNISLYDDTRLVGVIDLEVSLDTRIVEQKIRAAAGSGGIRASSLGNRIVLSGMAADAVAADRAVQIAKSVSPEIEVVNTLQVAPTQQVMLEVRFLEATREAGRQLGVSWFGANSAGTHGVRTGLGPVGVNGTTPTTPSGIPIFATAGSLVGSGISSPFGTFIARALTTNNTQLDVVVTALEDKGLIRRLAEPNLMALSGDQANFLAGGEFPVPVSSTTVAGVPTIAIEFKKFGVQLNFKPVVLSRGTINLKVEPEVSELDYTNAVTLSGTIIPSLTKRNASTTVELRDGQSFAIAGLLSATNTRDISQLPWIGTVPVLGALFRSSAYQQKETDLIIIVTPRLVSPAVPGQQLATPFDSRLPSNDADFFLGGQPEVKKRFTEFVAAGGEVKGPYGHIIAVEQPMPPAARISAKN